MLLDSYIQESKQDKILRYLKKGSLYLAILFFLYSLFCIFFVQFSAKEQKKSLAAFYKRPPDLISVFTGDQGRIPYAIKIFKSYQQPPILITGVYSKNSVVSLLKPLKGFNQIDLNKMEIDYLARNTVENVISTLRYLREKKGMKKILIISHDYHLMRIKLIMDSFQDEKESYQFYYQGVESDYFSWRSLKILYKEVFKYMRTYAFLFFWDKDSTIEN